MLNCSCQLLHEEFYRLESLFRKYFNIKYSLKFRAWNHLYKKEGKAPEEIESETSIRNPYLDRLNHIKYKYPDMEFLIEEGEHVHHKPPYNPDTQIYLGTFSPDSFEITVGGNRIRNYPDGGSFFHPIFNFLHCYHALEIKTNSKHVYSLYLAERVSDKHRQMKNLVEQGHWLIEPPSIDSNNYLAYSSGLCAYQFPFDEYSNNQYTPCDHRALIMETNPPPCYHDKFNKNIHLRASKIRFLTIEEHIVFRKYFTRFQYNNSSEEFIPNFEGFIRELVKKCFIMEEEKEKEKEKEKNKNNST